MTHDRDANHAVNSDRETSQLSISARGIRRWRATAKALRFGSRWREVICAAQDIATELKTSLHTKSAELHHVLHTKSEEVHATLHTKSDEVHGSLNALHQRMERLEQQLTRPEPGRPPATLWDQVSALQEAVGGLANTVSTSAQGVRTALNTIDDRLAHHEAAQIESLAYVGRSLRALRDLMTDLSQPTNQRNERVGTQAGGAQTTLSSQLAISHVTLNTHQQSPESFSCATSEGVAVSGAVSASRSTRVAGPDWRRGCGMRSSSDEAPTDPRIVSLQFFWRVLPRLAPGAHILDVAGAQHVLGLSLASLGFKVTVVDPRGYPFRHPSLAVVKSPLEHCDLPQETFDGIVCLSDIGQIGLGADTWVGTSSDAHFLAMQRLRHCARRNSLLALAIPFWTPNDREETRLDDRERLARLLEGWEVDEYVVVDQQRERRRPSSDGRSSDPRRSVALVTASRQ